MPGEPIISDEPELVRADQIKVGDILDLQDDPYADPDHGGTPDHLNSFEFELQAVHETKREGSTTIVLGGENWLVGFPVDHLLKRHGHDDRFEDA